MSEWISIKDKLPEYTTSVGGVPVVYVIAHFPPGLVTEAEYSNGEWRTLGVGVRPGPSHWMPLPDPPTADREQSP